MSKLHTHQTCKSGSVRAAPQHVVGAAFQQAVENGLGQVATCPRAASGLMVVTRTGLRFRCR